MSLALALTSLALLTSLPPADKKSDRTLNPTIRKAEVDRFADALVQTNNNTIGAMIVQRKTTLGRADVCNSIQDKEHGTRKISCQKQPHEAHSSQ
jgi:hypothetical protein